MRQVWQEIINIANKTSRDFEIINGDIDSGHNECINLNIPVDSVLYSVVTHSKGIIIDHWIRVWGQTSSVSNGVFYYNNKYGDNVHGLFLVASDVLGGLYAVNITRYNDNNLIWYFAPDTLEWECLDMKYNEFIAWVFQGNIDDFYSTMRWENWENDVKEVNMNNAILVYPFLWAKECDIEIAKKKIIPIDEIINLNFEYSIKIN